MAFDMAAASSHEELTGVAPRRARSGLSSATTVAALGWTVGGLCVLALLTMLPLGGPILLAAWLAIIVAPLANAITRRWAKRQRVAAVLSVGLVLVVLAPLSIV